MTQTPHPYTEQTLEVAFSTAAPKRIGPYERAQICATLPSLDLSGIKQVRSWEGAYNYVVGKLPFEYSVDSIECSPPVAGGAVLTMKICGQKIERDILFEHFIDNGDVDWDYLSRILIVYLGINFNDIKNNAAK